MPVGVALDRADPRRLDTGSLAKLLLANLDAVADSLEAGAIVAFTRAGVRIRKLPLP
jgi:hypothetical protein